MAISTETTRVSTVEPTKVVRTTRHVEGEPTQSPRTYHKKKTIFRIYQVVWYILGVIEVLLAFRIVLRFFGAAPTGFTSFIYVLSDPLALPFSGILRPIVTGNSVLETSTFIAIAVYLVVAYGIVQLLEFVRPVTPEEVDNLVTTTPTTP